MGIIFFLLVWAIIENLGKAILIWLLAALLMSGSKEQ